MNTYSTQAATFIGSGSPVRELIAHGLRAEFAPPATVIDVNRVHDTTPQGAHDGTEQ